MKKFIVRVLNSRPHQTVMEYEVEWNDGSINWVREEVMIKKKEVE